jgi:DNA repair exonuclease SbcCD ATPase subunit
MVTVTLTETKKEFNISVLREALDEEYKARISNLEGEEKALNQELESLSENQAQLKAQADARVRVLERKYDDLIAEGKHEKGEALQEKIAEAKAQAEKIEHRQAAIFSRLQQIEKDKHAEAGRTLAIVFPDFQSVCWDVLDTCFSFLDQSWEILENFSRETSVRVSHLNHRGNLRPYAMGKGKALHGKITEWFPGS